MKSVLILAYDFPPLNSIGAQRPYSWHKYFNNFNVDSTVITKNWTTESNPHKNTNEKILSIEIKEKFNSENLNSFFTLLRKISTLFSIYIHHIFLATNPKYEIYKAAEKFLSNNKVDYIIATGEPFVLFIYASKLSKKFNIPWVADYRDGWSFNYHLNYQFLNKLLLKPFFSIIEKRHVKTASIITTVSSTLKKELTTIFKNKPIKIIYNGFDKELFNFDKVFNKNDKLTFIYAGSIYPYQRIDIFLDALNEYLIENTHHQLKIELYGIDNFSNTFNSIIKNYPKLKTCLKVFPKQQHKEILEKQSKADVLLLFAGKKVDGSAAKIFEYFALNKKILLSINDNGTLANLITETNSGIICNNKNEVKKAIESLYNEWELNGKIKNQTINFEQYSRSNQTQKLAALLYNN